MSLIHKIAFFCAVVLASSSAWADSVFYYRTSNGTEVASTTHKGRVDADRELRDLGPGIAYVRFDTEPPFRSGHDRYWRNGRIEFEERQDHRDRVQRRNQVRQSLRDRGFTPNEIRELLDRND